VMTVLPSRLRRAGLALIGIFPAEEVSANLHILKQVMETGRMTDTSDSVAGKFGAGSESAGGQGMITVVLTNQ